jgi:hypothetical protein
MKRKLIKKRELDEEIIRKMSNSMMKKIMKTMMKKLMIMFEVEDEKEGR